MSVSAPWTLKNECANPQCQHEKDSHHLGQDNCLVLHCDCKRFYTATAWEVEQGLKQQLKDWGKALEETLDEAPDTPKMPGWGPWP